MSKKKQLNEFNSWSTVRTPSPYKITRAPNPVMNADSKLKQDYFYQKAEENQNFIEKKQLVGQLDGLQPMIMDVYQQFTNMRNLIEKTKSHPLATDKQKKVMSNIQKIIDIYNETMLNDIVPMLDELGVEGLGV